MSNDLHDAIMRLPCDTPHEEDLAGGRYQRAYKEGHRDARHAAAELALGYVAATPPASGAEEHRPAFETWLRKEYPGLLIDFAPLTKFYKGDDGARIGDMWDGYRAAIAVQAKPVTDYELESQAFGKLLQRVVEYGFDGGHDDALIAHIKAWGQGMYIRGYDRRKDEEAQATPQQLSELPACTMIYSGARYWSEEQMQTIANSAPNKALVEALQMALPLAERLARNFGTDPSGDTDFISARAALKAAGVEPGP